MKAFYDAGCRYLQFDDTAWAYLCSDVEMKKAKDRGMNVATLADDYTKLINDSIRDKPADMTITTHVCRGNFRSTWISSGGYEPVAESLLAKCNYDGYFLEYDSERAGGFEPLRFLPKGNKIVVLGRHFEERHAGAKGSGQTAHRGSGEVRAAGTARLEPAMRICLDRGRQCADRGAAMGEDARDRRARRRGVGLILGRIQALRKSILSQRGEVRLTVK